MRLKIFHVAVIIGIGLLSLNSLAQENSQENSQETEDVASIKTAIESYVSAFNSKDVDKLIAHWSPNGVYTSRTTGETSNGREELRENFRQIFDQESVPKIAVVTNSIEFVSPNVALERGAATITHSESDVVETDYSVVYVKRDEVWLIDRVTEAEILVEESHRDELQDLEWLIGDWSVEGEGFRVEFRCQWTAKENFISRSFKVFDDQDEVESSGLQIIGWDEKNDQIRSWLFDSDGGVIEGVWSKRSDGWSVQSVVTLADGGSGSFTSVFRPQSDGIFTWEKINRVLDGKLLPNIDEIEVRRD